jgi:hypothetical protein
MRLGASSRGAREKIDRTVTGDSRCHWADIELGLAEIRIKKTQ